MHLQLSMLAEREGTKNKQMLHTVCQEFGLNKPAGDQEVSALTQSTAIFVLAKEVEKAREAESLD